MLDELTPREAAAELGVTVRTVQRWIADGRLSVRRVGSRVRIPRTALADVAESSAGAASQPIGALLVANRGEIVPRIARTARRMGVRTIGVRATNDRAPLGIDEVHDIPSYLDGEAIIDAARLAGADAIHPGYGFLAENAQFAEAVEAAGLIWVGPPPGAIRAMGDKAAARQTAADDGVPTVPGYDGPLQDDRTLAAEAARIGFPLIVKPSAGGGGKGMHVVHEPASLPAALDSARREAERSFGDRRLILERYLGGSRHVEVQLLFDAHGAGTHLGERDCSAQRRSQKVVEEAPAPSVAPNLRSRMGEAAVRVGAAVGYIGAGTVEMLLTDDGDFYFLEMNTRLQVEHPVTEAVTGRDLVEDQLRVAAGASLAQLGLSGPPSIQGHAIEARIYAEDPESGFLPATGTILDLVWPQGVRIDAGVERGDVVGDRYDPMLAKLVAHGGTREEALRRLTAALDETRVLGVRTNVRFLRWLLRTPQLAHGEMRTDSIASLDLPGPPEPGVAHWRAAAMATSTAHDDLWGDGWRLNAPRVRRVRHGTEERSVTTPATPDTRGTDAGPAAALAADGTVHVDVEGQDVEFHAAAAPTVADALRRAAAATGGASAVLTAPMPGRVIAIRAAVGAHVSAHEPIVVIEAMKMEHAIVAPADGTLVALSAAVGQQVQRGDILGEVAQSPG